MKRRLVIAGGNGFLGRVLTDWFRRQNDEVIVLTRSPQERGNGVKEVLWDAKTIGAWSQYLEGAEAVINLTGRSVDCRYHARNRRLILASRIDSTRVIGEAIAHCQTPPRAWLNASSATYYKHSFVTPWGEQGEVGATAEAHDEFSIEVIRQWEKALNEAVVPQTRKVALRATLVLGAQGGVFPVLRRLARLGLGRKMGNGRQMVSWIHEVDFCRAVEFILNNDDCTGPINLAAPEPLPNQEFMQAIRKSCHRTFGLPAPKWALEIGAFCIRTETELILKSRYVVPGKLLAKHFQFLFPTVAGALDNLAARTETFQTSASAMTSAM